MLLYNLFPLLAGTVENWPKHLDRAAEMGFDWIFVNPVQRPGSSGSLYSVADYFQLNPQFFDSNSVSSPEAQMKSATEAAEARGLKMMVDLVINHCAIDADLTQQHPEWFIHEPDGSIAHPSADENGKKVVWYDLARFDYEGTHDPEGLYRYMSDVVIYLIELGFKGFRCDAAYQIPRSIWERLISDTKSRHPDVVFVAETLGCTADETKQTALAGFDCVFNSSKWWDYESPWLMEQYQLVREITSSISFPESHDSDRLFAETAGNLAAMKQRYLFAAFFSTGVMLPIGFEFGFRKPLHVVETRPEDWEETDVDLREFIGKINSVKNRYEIFKEECPTSVLSHNNPNILVLWKASAKTPEEALIVLNKAPKNPQTFYVDDLCAYVQAGAPLMDVSPEYPMEYISTHQFSYDLNPGQGLVMVTARD